MITLTTVEPPVMAAHAAVLAELHAACFPVPWAAAEIAKLLAMPGAFAAIAVRDNDPAGFHLSRSAGGEAEIISIGTHPHAQRRGVGRALLQNVFDRASRSRATALFVEVAVENTAAAALYLGAGFVEVGRRAGYYGSGANAQDALVLRVEVSNDAG